MNREEMNEITEVLGTARADLLLQEGWRILGVYCQPEKVEGKFWRETPLFVLGRINPDRGLTLATR